VDPADRKSVNYAPETARYTSAQKRGDKAQRTRDDKEHGGIKNNEQWKARRERERK
jgi:hypothetical protein